MRIEELAGKAGTLQAFVGGFEAEDVLYLLPIATLCDSTLPLLIAAAVGAPLYAIMGGTRIPARDAQAPLDALELRLTRHGPLSGASICPRCSANFADQGAFLFIPEFLTAESDCAADRSRRAHRARAQSQLPARTQARRKRQPSRDRSNGSGHRRAVPNRRCCSTGSRSWPGEPVQPSPAQDPHAYALYFYTRPGDHIGWHYDTSYYAGRRYTLLLGLHRSFVLPTRLRVAHA